MNTPISLFSVGILLSDCIDDAIRKHHTISLAMKLVHRRWLRNTSNIGIGTEDGLVPFFSAPCQQTHTPVLLKPLPIPTTRESHYQGFQDTESWMNKPTSPNSPIWYKDHIGTMSYWGTQLKLLRNIVRIHNYDQHEHIRRLHNLHLKQ